MGANKIIMKAVSTGVTKNQFKVQLGHFHADNNQGFQDEKIANGVLYFPLEDKEMLGDQITIALVKTEDDTPDFPYDYRAIMIKKGSLYKKYMVFDYDYNKIYNYFYIPNSAWSPDLEALVIHL